MPEPQPHRSSSGRGRRKRYRLILFDCVNTLYLPDASRLPTLELDGERVTSTAGLLQEVLAVELPGVEPERIHRAARAAWRWCAVQRGSELREVPAPVRFRRLLGELGLPEASDTLMQRLLETHFRAVTASFVLPEAHRALLAGLRDRYRLALFSNFDHAPALRGLLSASGIDAWLDPILISDGLGYRKPGAAAFSRALERLGVAPRDILLVGDSLEDDVQGANLAGLDVAWVNRARAIPASDAPRPTYELAELPALADLLQGTD